MNPEEQNKIDEDNVKTVKFMALHMGKLQGQKQQQEQQGRDQQSLEGASDAEWARHWVLQQRGVTNAAQVPLQPPAAPLVNPPELRLEQAWNNVDDVKNAESNQPDGLQKFLETLRDYKHGDLDEASILTRFALLFREHPGLVNAFNRFLPPDQREAPLQPPATPSFVPPEFTQEAVASSSISENLFVEP